MPAMPIADNRAPIVDGGPHDEEEGVVVAFQLGALVGVEGVLDGQGVQAEGARDGLELVLGGFVQADPDEAVPSGVAGGHRPVEGEEARSALAVFVEGAVDHGVRVRPRRWRCRWCTAGRHGVSSRRARPGARTAGY
ncbi:hypothetical protein GCM10010317_055520 [Streptomyces mirabilis]|nr:hypothetical protein GCM10010317_055520 [Streptomyces mirabilis]